MRMVAMAEITVALMLPMIRKKPPRAESSAILKSSLVMGCRSAFSSFFKLGFMFSDDSGGGEDGGQCEETERYGCEAYTPRGVVEEEADYGYEG